MILFIAVAFVILLLAGVPIGLILITLSVIYVLIEPAIMDVAFIQRVITGTQSFPLLAVPLFILTGELMNISGVTKRVMRFAALVTQRVNGGLAQTNILLSTLLAGMSGSANGDAAMQSKMIVPEMTKRGYPVAFSTALTASSALIAPMIPPGIGLILFGFVTDTSIGRLFAGAVLPGLLLAVALMLLTHVITKRNRWDPPDFTPRETSLAIAFIEALPAILLPILIIIGIRFGIFTPSEAAAAAVLYTAVFIVIFRESTLLQIWNALRSTVITTAAIMLVLAASAAFSWILTFERIPQMIGSAMLASTDNWMMMLALVACIIFLAGLFIEGTALILILAPMFLPVVVNLGIDPVHYGVVFVLMAHLGGITPPVGTVMFTACTVTRVPILAFSKAVWPFILIYIVVAAILIMLPPLSTFLAKL